MAGVARVALLVAAAAIAGWLSARRLADASTPGSTWVSDGLADTATSSELWIGAALAVIAIRLPASASDTWFEYRFGRGRPEGKDGHRPVSAPAFAVTGLIMAAGLWVGLVGVGAVGYHLASAGLGNVGRLSALGWVGLVAVAVTVTVVVVAVGERSVRIRVGGERPLIPLDHQPNHPPNHEAEAQAEAAPEVEAWGELASLADRFGFDPGLFQVVDGSDDGPPGKAGRSMMAGALGLGPNRRVVLDRGLLEADGRLRDFVVAHELAHLARHHVAIRVLTAGVGVIAMAAIVAAAVVDGRLWRWFGLTPADPLGLALVVLVAVMAQLLVQASAAWLSRAQERSADAIAASNVAVPDAGQLSRMYVDAGVDLDPPRWARAWAEHPLSAERLELLSRFRRLKTGSAANPVTGRTR